MKKVMAYKANDGTFFDSYNECLRHETKDYPKIEGYTCYGDYYLADNVILNVTLKEACEIKEVVTLPNGKTVFAHTLSKEELETIPRKERKCGKWYWTSTPNDDIDAYHVNYRGDFYKFSYINTGNGTGGARLGFKNPFLN